MAIYRLGDFAPEIPASAYVAREATVIGRVRLGERASVWPWRRRAAPRSSGMARLPRSRTGSRCWRRTIPASRTPSRVSSRGRCCAGSSSGRAIWWPRRSAPRDDRESARHRGEPAGRLPLMRQPRGAHGATLPRLRRPRSVGRQARRAAAPPAPFPARIGGPLAVDRGRGRRRRRAGRRDPDRAADRARLGPARGARSSSRPIGTPFGRS